jgi:hypothetical protein
LPRNAHKDFRFFSDSQSQTFHLLDEKEGKVRLCTSEKRKISDEGS